MQIVNKDIGNYYNFMLHTKLNRFVEHKDLLPAGLELTEAHAERFYPLFFFIYASFSPSCVVADFDRIQNTRMINFQSLVDFFPAATTI